MNIMTLYRKGLLFLKDLVEEYGTDEKMLKLILNIFFDGKYTEFRFKTLNYIQKDAIINECFKEIIAIIEKMYIKIPKPIAIRLDVNNVNNTILPVYINTLLFDDYEDATICFKELVIPLIYGKDEFNTHTKQYLVRFKNILGKPGINREELILGISELLKPEFYFPSEDTYYGFIHIDDTKLTNSPKDEIGVFTNTTDFRIVNIGTQIHVEFVKDDTLYKRTINLKSDNWYLEMLNLLAKSRALSKSIALLSDYQDTKRRVHTCLEN